MIIRGNKLTDEIVVEIGRFTILWNCFERYICANQCSPAKIKDVYKDLLIDKVAQEKLAAVLNERRSWFGQVICDYVDTGLYPGNARRGKEDDSILMQEFMKQDSEELRCGCLLVIHRLRNNLMHGLKLVEELNEQLTLFQAANEVLESIERVSDA